LTCINSQSRAYSEDRESGKNCYVSVDKGDIVIKYFNLSLYFMHQLRSWLQLGGL
jgi:hypothetical protein